LADDPFPDEADPRAVHAVFRNGPLTAGELAAEAAGHVRRLRQPALEEKGVAP
jgi:hypothetical protein